ncbi:hypothetical protein BDW75DRAFT_21745 [Aspergillus navahoensis]
MSKPLRCQLELASLEDFLFNGVLGSLLAQALVSGYLSRHQHLHPPPQVHVRGYIRHNQELSGRPQFISLLCYIYITFLFSSFLRLLFELQYGSSLYVFTSCIVLFAFLAFFPMGEGSAVLLYLAWILRSKMPVVLNHFAAFWETHH